MKGYLSYPRAESQRQGLGDFQALNLWMCSPQCLNFPGKKMCGHIKGAPNNQGNFPEP